MFDRLQVFRQLFFRVEYFEFTVVNRDVTGMTPLQLSFDERVTVAVDPEVVDDERRRSLRLVGQTEDLRDRRHRDTGRRWNQKHLQNFFRLLFVILLSSEYFIQPCVLTRNIKSNNNFFDANLKHVHGLFLPSSAVKGFICPVYRWNGSILRARALFVAFKRANLYFFISYLF